LGIGEGGKKKGKSTALNWVFAGQHSSRLALPCLVKDSEKTTGQIERCGPFPLNRKWRGNTKPKAEGFTAAVHALEPDHCGATLAEWVRRLAPEVTKKKTE